MYLMATTFPPVATTMAIKAASVTPLLSNLDFPLISFCDRKLENARAVPVGALGSFGQKVVRQDIFQSFGSLPGR